MDVGEKTWGVAFLSATELIRSLPLTQLRSLGYRGRRCGFNKKHQSTNRLLGYRSKKGGNFDLFQETNLKNLT